MGHSRLLWGGGDEIAYVVLGIEHRPAMCKASAWLADLFFKWIVLAEPLSSLDMFGCWYLVFCPRTVYSNAESLTFCSPSKLLIFYCCYDVFECQSKYKIDGGARMVWFPWRFLAGPHCFLSLAVAGKHSHFKVRFLAIQVNFGKGNLPQPNDRGWTKGLKLTKLVLSLPHKNWIKCIFLPLP